MTHSIDYFTRLAVAIVELHASSSTFIIFSWLARTNPADVARVESKTFIVTRQKREAVPTAKPGVQGQLGNWMSYDDMDKVVSERFPGCMKGKYRQRH